MAIANANTHTVRNTSQVSECKQARLQKRIGSTTYTINVYCNPKAKECMESKLLRIVEREAQK